MFLAIDVGTGSIRSALVDLNGNLVAFRVAGVASGAFGDFEDAVARCVEFGPAIMPDPAWMATYERLGKLFDDLHEASQGFYDRLDETVEGCESQGP